MRLETYEQIEKVLSAERLSSYGGKNDFDKKISNYIFNSKLSETFYFPLSIIEVLLRNAIYFSYQIHFPQHPFFALYEKDSRKKYLKKREFHNRNCWKMICGVIYKIESQSANISDGKIIAELNFGFWNELMLSNHNKYTTMWRNIFYDVFPFYPKQNNLSVDKAIRDIGDTVKTIRAFRNRIFHYEPIINYDITAISNDILKLASFIEPQAKEIVETFSNNSPISQHDIAKKISNMTQ